MTDILVPVTLPLAAADYIAQYGTASLYLEYGTATDTTDGTATATVEAGTQRYSFWVAGDTGYYYRFRVGDASTFTEYSPTFQMPAAYATLEEVTRGFDLPDTSRYGELDELLVQATQDVESICGGRSFFRDPVGTATTTLTLDIEYPGQSRLSLARRQGIDIVSLTTVGIADYTGDAYTTISAGSTGYYLPDTTPYDDLILSDQGTAFTTFPVGRAIVQLTGVFGWSSIPPLVKRATVDLVRFWWNARQSDGEPVGISAFGSPVFGPGYPKSLRDLQRSRYAWKRYVG